MPFPEIFSETIKVKVTPNSKKTEYQDTLVDGTIKIRLQACPTDGKANIALIDFLEKETGKRWKITHGITNSRKTLTTY